MIYLIPDNRLSEWAEQWDATNFANEFGLWPNDCQGLASLPTLRPIRRARRASGSDSKSGATEPLKHKNNIGNKHKRLSPNILPTYIYNYIERDSFNRKRASISNIVEVSTFVANSTRACRTTSPHNKDKVTIDAVPLSFEPEVKKHRCANKATRLILANLTSFSPKANEYRIKQATATKVVGFVETHKAQYSDSFRNS